VIRFEHATAKVVNPLLESWGHYLGDQTGPRLVLWYALYLRDEPAAVAVSASPRGQTCAGRPWNEVVELARICARPGDADLTRPTLRLWRKVAAQAWADAYGQTVTTLAAYSDSSRHAGDIYRFDGWTLYDEKKRGSGGTGDRGGVGQSVALKKLWIYPLAAPVMPRQERLFS